MICILRIVFNTKRSGLGILETYIINSNYVKLHLIRLFYQKKQNDIKLYYFYKN